MSQGKKPRSLGAVAVIVVVALIAISRLGLFGGKPATPNSPPPGGNPVLTDPAYRQTLVIASGSENKELEPLLEKFAKENKIGLDMRYQGSIDIARALGEEKVPFDAVWPASSLWISIGDTHHRVKHAESVSTTPVVFGVKKSLAQQLGFIGREVSVRDLLDKIRSGELKFCMTSATQSNSGCSAYIGFLYALLDNPDILSGQLLQQPQLRQDIKDLLGGVDRSSGSSEWLKTLFLEGEYDAMVNYESLILSTNAELVRQGREPLHIIYPYDGLSISDAPLGYVDQGDQAKQEAFRKLQDFLMSEQVQLDIQAYGRRTGYAGIDPAHQAVWNKDWGADSARILSPIRMPEADVLWSALSLYQTDFRKPSLTAYVLDYSGSMSGEPIEQLRCAMGEILMQDRAARNFLQASEQEENLVILFSSDVIADQKATGSAGIESLYPVVEKTGAGGGTAMYEGLDTALRALSGYDLGRYTPAIILMTDGQANGSMGYRDFERAYRDSGMQVPVFCISFGSADKKELGRIAELTHARVFDGATDLIDAFRRAKGYN